MPINLISNLVIAIAANKIDLSDDEEVDELEAREYAKSIGAIFKLTSAKKGTGIVELFQSIGCKVLDPNYIDKDDYITPKTKQVKTDIEINNDDYYKSEYEKLKKENELLKDEISKLNEELTKANTIISNSKNISTNVNDDEINKLKDIISFKENEINNLKLQLQNSGNNNKLFKYEDILFVHFISQDQTINHGIKCLKTETFAEVEEKLYQKYDNYRNTNNNFMTKGKRILRFKKICENGIQDGDKVELIKIE